MRIIESYLYHIKSNKKEISKKLFEEITKGETIEDLESIVNYLNKKEIKNYELRNFNEARLFYRSAITILELQREWDEIKKEMNVIYGISLSNRCYNTCDFCCAGASPNGRVMKYKKIENIKKEYLDFVKCIAFGGEGEPIYYKDGNKGLGDVIECFYDKGIKNFSILTGGIREKFLDNKFYLTQLFKIKELFSKDPSIMLDILITFHFHFKEYSISDLLMHYTGTFYLFTKIFNDNDNVKLGLKLLYHKNDDPYLFTPYLEEIAKMLNGKIIISSNNKISGLLVNDKILLIKDYDYINYAISKRDKKEKDKLERNGFCDGNLVYCPLIRDSGDAIVCPSIFGYDFLKPFANIFEDDFLERYRGKRKEIREYFENNFLDIIKGRKPYFYCDNPYLNK